MQAERSNGRPVTAGDMMTAKAVTVRPDASIGSVARLLMEHGLGAVPVVDGDGVPIGMVSDGDLIGRDEAARSWWSGIMAGEQPFDPAFRARFGATDRTAADVMSTPLVSVEEQTEAGEVGRLLGIYHVKQVPVVRDGPIVGIVSRADMARAAADAKPEADAVKEKHPGFLRGLFEFDHRAVSDTMPVHPAVVPERAQAGVTVEDFRHLVDDFHHGEAQAKDDARLAAAGRLQRRTAELIDTHVADDAWRQMLHRARMLAQKGQSEYMVLVFPSQLCIDGGRAINVAEDGWPATLRGEPAEIYLRWERELKPRGFKISAHVLAFPGGKPGDIGLFLEWKGIAQSDRVPG